jgi:hypothetical protein
VAAPPLLLYFAAPVTPITNDLRAHETLRAAVPMACGCWAFCAAK